MLLQRPPRSIPPTTTPASPAYRKYRFWPVYAAAFARTFAYSIYDLALPNFLIYFQHVPEDLLGLIVAITPFLFMVGSLVALPVTRWIGVRNTVIISAVGSVAFVGLQILFFDPWALIALRACDGFIIGFYWPNLQMEVSNWQRVAPKSQASGFFQRYALSWNTGILAGEIVGYLVVFTGQGNEYAAMVFAWVLMSVMVPCAVAIEKPGSTLRFQGDNGKVVIGAPSPRDRQKEPETLDSRFPTETPTPDLSATSPSREFLLAFPASFYLLGTLIYAHMKSFYQLIYPLALAADQIPSYWVYLVTFLHQAAQLATITVSTKKSAKGSYLGWFAGMTSSAAFLTMLWAAPSLLLLTVAFIASGVFSGWLYNFTSKIMLEYGSAKKSLKYATLYEFFNGIGFGFSPMLAGIVAKQSLALNFPVTLFIFTGFFILLLKIQFSKRRNL